MQRKKASSGRFKIIRTKFFQFVRRNFLQIIVLILSALLLYKPIVSYYTPVYFEEYYTYSDINTTNPQFITEYLWVRFSTQKAFLPNEPIKVEAKLAVTSKRGFLPQTTDFHLDLNSSELTSGRINKAHLERLKAPTSDSNTPSDVQLLHEFSFSRNPGKIFLQKVDENHYTGKGEIFYRKPGSYKMGVIQTGAGVRILNMEKSILEIGSTSELLNKKTNDLLYILTIINILLVFFAEFRRKS